MQRRIALRTQLVLWQLGTVLFVVLAIMATAITIQWAQLRDAYVTRALGVAQSVADLPAVREAFYEQDPAESIQPLAELIRKSSGMTYVVVTDENGIRYSHPNPDRIGELVSTDPSAALSGEVFTGKQEGTLGVTWRAKVPLYDDGGEVIGQVSVGILAEELRHDIGESVPWQVGVAVFVALVSGLGAIVTARIFRRRTLGLEPEQIAGLFEGREAILHGSRDGIVAADTEGRVILINDAARDMLELGGDADGTGRPASDLLSPELAAQLAAASGEEQLSLVGERRVIVRADPVSRAGEPVGTVLLLRDHTELHQMLTELEGAQSHTQRLHAQAHEFQNQLHVIDGLLELDDVEAARKYTHRLSTGGALPRLDSADAELDVELEALLLVKLGAAKERGIRVMHEDLHLWPQLPETDIQLRDDLLAVIANLLDNAIEATPTRGSIRIRLGTVPETSGVRIIVEDSGGGVPVHLQERIFEPRVTTKQSATPRGFGLPLVRRIARRLGGDVTIGASDLGGARFTVTLSVQATDGEVAGAEPGVASTTAVTP